MSARSRSRPWWGVCDRFGHSWPGVGSPCRFCGAPTIVFGAPVHVLDLELIEPREPGGDWRLQVVPFQASPLTTKALMSTTVLDPWRT